MQCINKWRDSLCRNTKNTHEPFANTVFKPVEIVFVCANAQPPKDAEVLFDGKDLSKWQNRRGQEATWKVADGYVETAARGGGIRTRGKWADFQLHVEWATPNPPRGTGQGRGNSGILINGMYEVQVLDSYQAKTYPDGQAGAIYGQSPPLGQRQQTPRPMANL